MIYTYFYKSISYRQLRDTSFKARKEMECPSFSTYGDPSVVLLLFQNKFNLAGDGRGWIKGRGITVFHLHLQRSYCRMREKRCGM